MESIVITTSNTVNTGVEKITPEQRCRHDAFLTMALWIVLAGFPIHVCLEGKFEQNTHAAQTYDGAVSL